MHATSISVIASYGYKNKGMILLGLNHYMWLQYQQSLIFIIYVQCHSSTNRATLENTWMRAELIFMHIFAHMHSLQSIEHGVLVFTLLWATCVSQGDRCNATRTSTEQYNGERL